MTQLIVNLQSQVDRIETTLNTLTSVETEVLKPALTLKIGPTTEQG